MFNLVSLPAVSSSLPPSRNNSHELFAIPYFEDFVVTSLSQIRLEFPKGKDCVVFIFVSSGPGTVPGLDLERNTLLLNELLKVGLEQKF